MTFTDEQLELTLTIDVKDGVAICLEYRVRRIDGGGLEMVTTEIARGINLRRLMSHAIAHVALEARGEGGFTPAHRAAVVRDMIAPVRRRRDPVTDERLREVADKYRTHYVSGIETYERFGDVIHVSGRQAQRLVKLARERGFLPAKGK